MIDGNKVKLFCRGLHVFLCGKVQYTQLIVMDEAKKKLVGPRQQRTKLDLDIKRKATDDSC